MSPNLQVEAPSEAQWLPDPSGRHQFRWHSGGRWTDAVADGPVTVHPAAGSVPHADRVPVVGAVVAGLGAVVAVVGAFLPWATITGLAGVADIAISGTEDGRDGVLTLTLAVVAMLVGVVMVAARSRIAAVVVTLAGVLVALVAAYDTSNISGTTSTFGDLVQVNVGSGLWLTLVAGVVMTVGGVLGIARR